jgi:hypothetical protein
MTWLVCYIINSDILSHSRGPKERHLSLWNWLSDMIVSCCVTCWRIAFLLWYSIATAVQGTGVPACQSARPSLIALESGCPYQARCEDNMCGPHGSQPAITCPPLDENLYESYPPSFRCACDPLCQFYGDCCFGLQLQDCPLRLQLPSHLEVRVD